MADHLKPTITSIYSNFVTEMDARFDDLAVGLDPAATTASNVPTNSIRWSSASNKWQKYNGAAWNDLSTLYSINISGNAATATNGVVTTGSYANPAWITSLAGSKITGDISGNAGTATRLLNSRNINGVAFDGTAAISVNLNNNVTFNNSGSGGVSGSSFNGSTALTISHNTVGAPSITGANASGTWGINITGNAATATTTSGVSNGTYSGTIDFTGSHRAGITAVPVLDINTSSGNYFTKTISANSIFTFSNAPTSRVYSFTLELTHTSGSVTFPSSVRWPNDSAPTLTTGRTHLLMFVTDDAGTRWRGAVLANYQN